eukprot:scaffold28662_cov43-Prasinocladus_malaysianus.AAC.1
MARAGLLPGGDTALAAIQQHQRFLPSEAAHCESLVVQRLEQMAQTEWSVGDVANYLMLRGHWDAFRVAAQMRMDGAAFTTLVDNKGKSQLARLPPLSDDEASKALLLCGLWDKKASVSIAYVHFVTSAVSTLLVLQTRLYDKSVKKASEA